MTIKAWPDLRIGTGEVAKNLKIFWGKVGEFIWGPRMGGRHHQKIQGCQIDQQIKSWSKDQLQDSIANKGMAWPNYRRFSFPS